MLTLVLLMLLVLARAFPFVGFRLGVIFLSLSLCIGSFAILQKQTGEYRQGRITRARLVWNVGLEIGGILLGMALASWLGRSAAQLATRPIADPLIKATAGILVGLLVGLGVGFVVKQTWGRLARA